MLLTAYGFGLFVGEHPSWGRVVSHSGGYPGFGSNMRWHPGTRTGVIALGNGTYSAMQSLAARILPAVLQGRQEAVQIPPWPQTVTARDKVSRLLRSWDDTEAARLFSPNVAQDAPFAERRKAIAVIRDRIGDFRDDGDRPAEFDTQAQCRWWLAGDRGVVQVQIQLTPEREPRVQSLTLAVPPAPGSPLRATLDALLAWLNGTRPRLAPGHHGLRHGRRGPAGPPPADGRRMGRRMPPRSLEGRRRRRLDHRRADRRARPPNPLPASRPTLRHPPPTRHPPVAERRCMIAASFHVKYD